ncbi:MAG: hypothetical protein J6Y89_04965 [Lachnospiraceae bacterium]|nr:hypothetical protein [Lachnospiraceae bacterium]
MICPKCGMETEAYDSRWHYDEFMPTGYQERRRQCLSCGYRYVTWELYMHETNIMRKHQKETEDSGA